jgi:hypothetical protein
MTPAAAGSDALKHKLKLSGEYMIIPIPSARAGVGVSLLPRRSMVIGLVTACCGCDATDSVSTTVGCMISDSDLDSDLQSSQGAVAFNIEKDPTSSGPDDPDFKRALSYALKNMSNLFGVEPGFAFFDDDTSNNAFASRSKRLGRQDGSVVFGQKMFDSLMTQPTNPDVGVAVVCAHEFGHIVQFKRGLYWQLVVEGRVKRLELHADFLAGYFAGRRRLEHKDYPAVVFAETMDRLGDTQFNNPQHHGTSDERGQAVVAGYECAFKDQEDFSTAVRTGVTYVQQIPI